MMSVSLKPLAMSLSLNPQYCQWHSNFVDVGASEAFYDVIGCTTFDDITGSKTFDDVSTSTSSSNSMMSPVLKHLAMSLSLNLQ